MSRIGKAPIKVPEKVAVTIKGHNVVVKGPKGQLEYMFPTQVDIVLKDGQVTVNPKDKTNKSLSLWGTSRTVLSNMVKGVTEGFVKDLEFTGVGYKAAVKGKVLSLSLGFSHPIDFDLPEGIEAKVVANKISILGSNKELVGFVAAKVRAFRPPEPYKGKGVRYSTEKILRKAGKTGAKK